MYYTYILRCRDGSLYTGIAADVKKRMAQHFGKTAQCAKYTRSRTPKQLEAVWESENCSMASKLEYRIKQLDKAKKQILIDRNQMDLLQKTDGSMYRRLPETEIGELR